MTDEPSPATDQLAGLADTSLEDLLGSVLIDEVPLAVVDESPVPPEWDALFAYADSFLQDPEEEPSIMMKMAAKAVTAWGRKNVHQDPEKARAMMLALVRDTARILKFSADELLAS